MFQPNHSQGVLPWLAVIALFLIPFASSPAADPPEQFEVLTTVQGKKYYDCTVKRVDVDGLFIEHRDGLGKVSFFDLDESIQNQFEFDPIAGIKRYQESLKRKRDLKWQRFWTEEKEEAEAAARAEREQFLAIVRETWLPVEARMVRRGENGAFVRASQIVWEPTKTRSKLGFEVDGPPRKKLVRINPGVIFIETEDIKTGLWTGYIEPDPVGYTSQSGDGLANTPIYRAVSRNHFK